MTPQVSVIMPIYKPEFLAAAIDSILAQTMGDFELILVNDGSPHEQVKEIAQSYLLRDTRIRYIEQENQGLAGARNTGAASAVSGYLMWMDDDDISLPDKMRLQWEFLQANPDVAAVNCAHCGIDENGHINRRYHGGKPFSVCPESIIQRVAPPVSDSPMVAIGPCPMVRKSAFQSIKGMRLFFRICEDTDFYQRLEEKYPVAAIPDVLFHYRFNASPQQLTKDKNFAYYYYAAKVSALLRKRGEDDPINEKTNIEDMIKLFPLLPTVMRRNFIRQWGKTARKHMRISNYETIKAELAFYRRLFDSDEKIMQKMERKIMLHALFRGHWRYFYRRKNADY